MEATLNLRDCINCKHHRMGEHPPLRCRECLDWRGLMPLPYWEPTFETARVMAAELEKKIVPVVPHIMGVDPALALPEATNDGSTADYYVLPKGATQLQDLISYRNMNAQLGEIQRAVYRYGQGHHSSRERDLKKIIFYAQAELDRLEKYE